MPIASTISFALTTLRESEEQRPLSHLLEFAPGAMVWTFVAFFVGLIFMWKFVYGPITTALEDRDQKVEDSIKAAEVARQQAEAQMDKAKGELAEAQANAKRIFYARRASALLPLRYQWYY